MIMSLRLPYIRWCISSVVSMPWRRLYSAQDSRWRGLESTMTPSISKISARILLTGRASADASGVLLKGRQFSVDPGEIVGRAVDYGKGENFRKFVGVRG